MHLYFQVFTEENKKEDMKFPLSVKKFKLMFGDYHLKKELIKNGNANFTYFHLF